MESTGKPEHVLCIVSASVLGGLVRLSLGVQKEFAVLLSPRRYLVKSCVMRFNPGRRSSISLASEPNKLDDDHDRGTAQPAARVEVELGLLAYPVRPSVRM
jgi:hypothetical protein